MQEFVGRETSVILNLNLSTIESTAVKVLIMAKPWSRPACRKGSTSLTAAVG